MNPQGLWGTKMRNWALQLQRDLEAPVAARRFGSGWFAGFFALLLAIFGLCLVASLRWPAFFAMPELDRLRDWTGFRGLVHGVLLAAYALALLSLMLRSRKAVGAAALAVALLATLLGGSQVQAHEGGIWVCSSASTSSP
jgi:hypothetical protein